MRAHRLCRRPVRNRTTSTPGMAGHDPCEQASVEEAMSVYEQDPKNFGRGDSSASVDWSKYYLVEGFQTVGGLPGARGRRKALPSQPTPPPRRKRGVGAGGVEYNVDLLQGTPRERPASHSFSCFTTIWLLFCACDLEHALPPALLLCQIAPNVKQSYLSSPPLPRCHVSCGYASSKRRSSPSV